MTQNSNLPAAPKRKNWLLAKSRQWHTWGGLLAALFLLVVGTSGIVLNYKKPVFTALGIEQEAKEIKTSEAKPAKQAKRAAEFTTATGFAAAAVSTDQALALARESLGGVALERIELKAERGEMIYKIKARGGAEIWINAATGSHYVKGEYEKVKADREGTVVARTTDWGKILLDLHTGKIGGEAGKAVMSVAALLLVFLSLSGVHLWAKPILLRRANAKAKASATAQTTAPVPLATARSRLGALRG